MYPSSGDINRRMMITLTLYPEGIAKVSHISKTPTFYQNYLAMSNTVHVTGGKPIAGWSQSISGNAINPLVAFYDIHGRKILLCYCPYVRVVIFKIYKMIRIKHLPVQPISGHSNSIVLKLGILIWTFIHLETSRSHTNEHFNVWVWCKSSTETGVFNVHTISH
jgi:hypothetical protein